MVTGLQIVGIRAAPLRHKPSSPGGSYFANALRLMSRTSSEKSGIPHFGNSGPAGDSQKSWPFPQSCYFRFASISPLADTVHGAHTVCAAVIQKQASRLCNKY